MTDENLKPMPDDNFEAMKLENAQKRFLDIYRSLDWLLPEIHKIADNADKNDTIKTRIPTGQLWSVLDVFSFMRANKYRFEKCLFECRAQEPTGDAVEALKAVDELYRYFDCLNEVERKNRDRLITIIKTALQTPSAGMVDPTKPAPEPTDALVEFMGGNAIPSGYALVPIEPTDDMLNSFMAEHETWVDPSDYGFIKPAYKAMIAAAPNKIVKG